VSDYDLGQTRRLLVLIAAAARAADTGDGVPIARAMSLTGLRSEKALRKLVEGTEALYTDPVEGDGAVGLEIEDGEVHVTFREGFDRVAAFSVAEGAMLAAALEPYAKDGARAVKEALRKLRKAIPEPLRPLADQMVRGIELVAAPPGPWFGTLREAIEARRETTLEYRAVADADVTRRVVEPRLLFHRDGCWYLAAWNVERGAEHLFRLDRIVTATLGDRTFAEHRGPPVARYGRRRLFFESGAEREVTLRFRGAAAREARLRHGARARDGGEGTVLLAQRLTPGNYLYGVVLGRGGEAEIDGPPDVAAAFQSRIAELRKLYG
jgi:proteasome accessory factor C